MYRRLTVLAFALHLLPALHAQVAVEPPTKLAEVVVTPSRFGVAEAATMPAASLTAAELEVLPQLGDDLFRSITRLPGLAADDISAQFWVRGAPQSELLARLDGVELLEPFHLKDVGGALSIVDPTVIRRLDLTTGGFSAEYGDRLAGVLTMDTQSDPRPLTALKLSLTGIGGGTRGVFSEARGRWMLAARRGYPDVALKIANRDEDVSPRYYDVTAKVEYDLSPAHTVSVHALHAGDELRYERKNSPSLSSSYDSSYLWARWLGEVTPALKGEALLSWARLTWDREGSGRLDGFPFFLRDHRQLDTATLRNEWTFQPGEQAVIRGGFEARTGDTHYDYALSQQYTAVQNGAVVVVTDKVNATLSPEGSAIGAYASVKLRPLAPLVIEPGIRFDHHDYTEAAGWSPRVNAALIVGATTVRAAWGEYSQAQGLHQIAVADGERTFGRTEQAEQIVLSLERALSKRIALRTEVYERRTTRVRPRWENLDNAYDLFPEAQSDRVQIAPSRGRARGFEVLLSSRGQSPWQWHASYAFARTEEEVDGKWVPRSHDQEHAFYTDVTYTPNPRWQFSAAWRFHSGWPTTDVVYSLTTLNNGRRFLVSTNGPMYGLRLPDYHRLDLRATRRYKVKRGEVRVFIDLFNAYDHVNLMGYDHNVSVSGTQVTDRKEPREQLPFLPSIGVSWEF